MIYKVYGFKKKAATENGGEFEGYASTFSNIDRMGDICVRGCFDKYLPNYMEDGIIAWQHDWSTPIGRPLEGTKADDVGLYLKASISDTTAGRDARTLMLDGVVRKMSIGFDIRDAEYLTSDNLEEYVDVTSVSLRDLELAMMWGRALKEIYLYEVSPVSVPANNMADITGVKGAAANGMPLEEQFRAVLAATADCSARFKSIADLRKAEGRVLGEANQARLKHLEKALKNMVEELTPLIVDETAPPVDPPAPEPKAVTHSLVAHELYSKFLNTSARFDDVHRR